MNEPPIAFLVDRDGVLERGKGGPVIPAARAFLERLTARGIPYLVATNHSTSAPDDAAEAMRAKGLPVERRHVLTPLDLLARRLGPPADGRRRRVLARGTPGFVAYLEEHLELEVVDTASADVDAVVLAFDRRMDHAAMSAAVSAVLDHGAELIAVHENRLFRDTDGGAEPGLGAWVRAIEYATGAHATVIGKPSPAYYRAALDRLAVDAAHTVMVSDDPFGDLAGARALGIRTVLVLTGKYASPEVLDRDPNVARPDRIVRSLDELDLDAEQRALAGGGAAAAAGALRVVPLEPSDWEAVRAIYAEGLATGDASFETAVPDWPAWDAAHRPGCRLVARWDGVIVGWAALSPVSRRHAYRGVAEVSVYVAAAARRRGVGRALLRALVACAERSGLWTLQAAIFPENTASVALHRAAGFREVGRRQRLGCLRGRWRDVILLEHRRAGDPPDAEATGVPLARG